MSSRGRWRRRIGATLLVVAALVVTLALAGDALLGRRGYFEGDQPVGASAWERAMRFAWFEEDAAIAGDDRGPGFGAGEIVFARKEDGIYGLFRRRATTAGFGPAEPLFELCGPTNDVDPVLSADGRMLVFASDRPGGRGGYDLWAARREGEGFAAPRNLGPGVNSESDERHPAVDAAGFLVLCSDRLSEDRRLETWICPPDSTGWGRAEPLAFTGLDGWEIGAPAFEPGGHAVVFCCAGPAGDSDLYRTCRLGDTWLEPEPLAGLNTPEDELDPSLSLEGGRLVFARTVPGTSGTVTRLVFGQRREIVAHREEAPPIWRYLLHVLAPLLIALALTYLWLKWGRLHPFIKFVILSLIAHLVLMMWVDPLPSGGVDGAADGGRAFRVHWLASPAESRAPTAARGDSIETPAVARASVAPSRAESEPATAPEASAPAATATARAAAAEAAPAERVELRAERSTRRVASAARNASSLVERRSGADGVPVESTPSSTAGRRVAGATVAQRGAASDVAAPAPVPAPSAGGTPRRAVAVRAPAAAARPARPHTDAPRADLHGGPADTGEVARARDAGDPAAPAPAPSATGSSRLASTPSPVAESARSPGRAGERSPEAVSPGSTLARRAVRTGSGETAAAAGVPAPEVPRAHLGTTPARTEEARGERPVAAAAEAPPLEARPLTDGRGRETAAAVAGRGTLREPSEMRGVEPPRSSLASRAVAAAVLAPDPAGSISPRRLPLARTGPPAPRANTGEPARTAPGAAAAAPLAPRALTSPRLRTSGPPSGSRAVDPGVVVRAVPAPPDMLRRRTVALARPEVADARPYASRRGRAKLEAIRISGGSDETEAAVLAGLRYLARRQQRDGGWGRPAMDDKYRDVRIGKSGLAILAFLGAGSTHTENGEFRDTVTHALAYLRREQDRVTGHIGDGASYSHGIATYALAEAYAMTKDRDLREPLTRAVQRILAAQHRAPGRPTDGGWGYYYRDPDRRYDSWPRLSVTAWQIMALESARIGGLAVPDESLERARTFVLHSFDGELEALRYDHDPRWLASGFPTLPGSNAAAAFVMPLLGVARDDPRLVAALDFVARRPPTFRWRRASSRNFVERCHGNLYFHYYAALAMHRRGGDRWRRWNESLKPLLVENQSADGSWAPISPYAEFADDTDGDRAYTTAMCVLVLEVYYRYFTPLLKTANVAAQRTESGVRVEIVDVTGRKSRSLGLRSGDVIVLVDTTHVRDLDDLQKAIAGLRDDGRVPLIVRRGDRQIVRVLAGRLTGLRIQEVEP